MIIVRNLFIGIVCACAIALGFIWFQMEHMVDIAHLEQSQTQKPSVVLDDEGNEWFTFSIDKRECITIQQIPQHLINAFIAAEDHNFFNHCGISFKGIVRSFLINCYHGKIIQGASTITQQLVKLLYFDGQKTLQRKIKEQYFALLVELYYSKEQIIQAYLNNVYFGCGIYGVQAASQCFWNKDVSEISVDQAATLAAIVKSPGHYCPLLFPLSSQKRRNIVLQQMRNLGFITQTDANAFIKKPIVVEAPQHGLKGSHCKELIRRELESVYGKKILYGGGLRIKTTINQTIQNNAEQSVYDRIIILRKKLKVPVDVGLVTIAVSTGAIKALVGGYDFNSSQFNRATQARRQMGSIFKTLIYAAAIKQGMHFNDIVTDEPLALTINNHVWKPQNSNNIFEGPMTLARALMQSNNIVTIKTLLQIGYDPVVTLAKRCHLPSVNQYPSLALGCVDATPLEVVGMFNVFANNGLYVQPYYIEWVKDAEGKKLQMHNGTNEFVMQPAICQQVSQILSLPMERAKKRFKQWIDAESIGKTGTTNDCRTCWFAGSTPEYCTVMYTGCDDNRSLGKDVYGSMTAFPIWLSLYRTIVHSKKTFARDPQLQQVVIDGTTGEYSDVHNSTTGLPILL